MTHDTITVAGRRIFAPSRDPLSERDMPTHAQLRAVAAAWEDEKRELTSRKREWHTVPQVLVSRKNGMAHHQQ